MMRKSSKLEELVLVRKMNTTFMEIDGKQSSIIVTLNLFIFTIFLSVGTAGSMWVFIMMGVFGSSLLIPSNFFFSFLCK